MFVSGQANKSRIQPPNGRQSWLNWHDNSLRPNALVAAGDARNRRAVSGLNCTKMADFRPIFFDLRRKCPIMGGFHTFHITTPYHYFVNGGHVTFQVGDKVIYPNHGLGVVERIEEKTILGTTCGFYHLRIIANETTVLVPVANADEVGLRRAISDEEVERLFGRLGDGKIDDHQNWKGRFKDNSDKMRSGSIFDMADVLKSLTFLSRSKSLSFREKRMLDRARALIITEVSDVIREKSTVVEGRVDQALERCFTTKARLAERATASRSKTRPAATVVARANQSAPRNVRAS
jgi:CarD family transcriptional regulator